MKAFLHNNKLLLTSILSFIGAIIAVVTVGFAWFAESDTGKAGNIVSQIGDLGSQYQFGQVLAGSDSEFTPHESEFFEYDEVLPGSTYTFAISVANDGTMPGYFSLYLYKILSCYLSGPNNDIKSYDYLNREEKIQYAFNYCIKEVYWTPYSTSLISLQVDQDDPLPTNDYVAENNWIKWTDEEKLEFYEQGLYMLDPESNAYENTPVIFNQESSEGVDEEDYYMLNRVVLNPQSEDPNQKSCFVVFFQFDFLSNAVFPPSLETETLPSSNVYINQIIEISNIVIVATKE